MILDVRLQVLLRVRFCSKYVFEKCLRIHDFEKDFRSDFVQRLLNIHNSAIAFYRLQMDGVGRSIYYREIDTLWRFLYCFSP